MSTGECCLTIITEVVGVARMDAPLSLAAPGLVLIQAYQNISDQDMVE